MSERQGSRIDQGFAKMARRLEKRKKDNMSCRRLGKSSGGGWLEPRAL